MFKINNINEIEPLNIYIAKPDDEILGCINDSIDSSTASLRIGLNRQFEFSCEVSSDCQWYDYIQDGMYLFVENVGYFRICSPTSSESSNKSYKNFTAKSCDCELEDYFCQFSEGTGTRESLERNVVYDVSKFSDSFIDMAESELVVNPETDIPYDWIVLYNTYSEQLSQIKERWKDMYTSHDKTVTDSELVKEICNTLEKFPRLKRRYKETKVIEYPDYSETEIEVSKYTVEAFVTIEYENNEAKSIHFEDEFENRIDFLIEFYRINRDQLSLLSLVLETTGGNWSVGTVYGVNEGDYTLADKKFPFDINESAYSFLTQTFAKSSECVVTFDIFDRKINITPVNEIGNDTGIVLTYDNLVNSLNISSANETTCTRLYVTGSDDIGISMVNFGFPYIDDISYKLNAKDRNGNYIYVSKELSDKYKVYSDDFERSRQLYIEQSKIYNDTIKKIDEINYKVPLDDLKTDWGTFDEKELIEHRNNYRNLLNALISIYKEDYHINESAEISEDHIKTTPYWHDYKAYLNIIEEIDVALAVFPYYSDDSMWENRYSKEKVEELKNKIKAWETEWSLYGIKELEGKIAAYENQIKLLKDSVVVNELGYSKEWGDESNTGSNLYLTDEERAKFNNDKPKYESNKKIYDECKMNCDSAKEYLDKLYGKTDGIEENLTVLESGKNDAQTKRLNISDSVSLHRWSHTNDDASVVTFTEEDIKTINRFVRDSTYQNSNFVITTINTPEEEIDIMEELFQDGKEKLSTYSRPQLSFIVESENLLALPEYEPFWKDFMCGNYITVQYRDDTYIRLRLVGYTFNPLSPTPNGFSIEFSNYILSKSKISDLESILGISFGSGSGGVSTGSGSSGEYGNSEDINITISNTMLARLLNSESFGTRVSDVILDTIKLDSLYSRYAEFKDLSSGKTIIDGGCIKTGLLKSENYNGTDDDILSNTVGSVINLNDGTFSLAGGLLKFQDGILNVEGKVNSGSGIIGGWIINDGCMSNYLDSDDKKTEIGNVYISLRSKIDSENLYYIDINKLENIEYEDPDGSIYRDTVRRTIIGFDDDGWIQSYGYGSGNILMDGLIKSNGYNIQCTQNIINKSLGESKQSYLTLGSERGNEDWLMGNNMLSLVETNDYLGESYRLYGDVEIKIDRLGFHHVFTHPYYDIVDENHKHAIDSYTFTLGDINNGILETEAGLFDENCGKFGIELSNNQYRMYLLSTSVGMGFGSYEISNNIDGSLFPLHNESLGNSNYYWSDLYVKEAHFSNSVKSAKNLGIDRGIGSISFDATKDGGDPPNGNGSARINFSNTYKSVPNVTITLNSNPNNPLNHALAVTNITKTYFDVKYRHASSTQDITASFQWIAIGEV